MTCSMLPPSICVTTAVVATRTSSSAGEPGGRGAHEGGTGLGLAICKRLIESASGTIEVSETGDRGTTFLITLPVAADGAARAAA